MKKNDILEIEITGLTSEGDGVGRAEGMAVFVPGGVPGDRLRVTVLKVKKDLAYGKAAEVVEPSPDRTEPDCAVFGRCGGCSLRNIKYEKELMLKTARVVDCMRRIGGIDIKPEPILYGSPDRYRNKAQYPVGRDKNGICAGFYARHSHRVAAAEGCRLQPEEFSCLLAAVLRYARENGTEPYDEQSGRGLLRNVYIRRAAATGEIMLTLVINGKKIPNEAALVKSILETGAAVKSVVLNENTEKTNVILGKRCRTIYGADHINDVLRGVRVRLSPLSFYQVNHDMAGRLYEKAEEYAEPQGKTVLDLYCGAGTIGLSMADKAARVIGVEIVPQAAEDARMNAAENGIENAEFICGDAAAAAGELARRGLRPDVVILDPPRKGASPELLKLIDEKFSPERIVYISCDPATLARDCARLGEYGWKVARCTPVDMFPRTNHVETVVLLRRKNIDDHLEFTWTAEEFGTKGCRATYVSSYQMNLI